MMQCMNQRLTGDYFAVLELNVVLPSEALLCHLTSNLRQMCWSYSFTLFSVDPTVCPVSPDIMTWDAVRAHSLHTQVMLDRAREFGRQAF
jgi:hypothetical protein